MIPISNPRASYIEHKEEIDKAVLKVLSSGSYILREEVNKFEDRFAKYIGVKHCIGVASGTDALFLSMKALGIGKGDEVITVSHTAVATVSAIVSAGANPVLIDIKDNFTMNPEKIHKAITKRTKAIIPVHLYGKPCDMNAIMAYNIPVIEDCAQAAGAIYHGKHVGSIGKIGCFSFYPTKNLGCFGDGGAITTNDKKLDKNLRLLREYGWKKRYISSIHGYNSRLDEIQAAVLNVKLKYIDQDNERRREVAKIYGNGNYDENSVYHLYVVRRKNRGKEGPVHYPVPIHLQPAYKDVIVSGCMRETEKASKEVLSLPMYPQLC